jgi:hypothetical protein
MLREKTKERKKKEGCVGRECGGGKKKKKEGRGKRRKLEK